MNKKIERDTKQRTAIKAALDAADRPLNVHEIHEGAARKVPNLGIATVYRNLKAMLEKNEIVRIGGAGIPDCYATVAVADLCADVEHHPLYQVGASLYLDEPKGFVLDCPYKIYAGHITTGRIG